MTTQGTSFDGQDGEVLRESYLVFVDPGSSPTDTPIQFDITEIDGDLVLMATIQPSPEEAPDGSLVRSVPVARFNPEIDPPTAVSMIQAIVHSIPVSGSLVEQLREG